MSDDNVIPFPSQWIEIGGPIESARVSLNIYDEDLDPDEITRILGLAPTRSHRRGDRRRPESPPARIGYWGYKVDSEAPHDGAVDAPDHADRVLGRLLDRLPSDPVLWAGLVQKYEIRIVFCVSFEGWNKGFRLSARNIQRAAVLGVPLDFDLYADDNCPPEFDEIFSR